MALAVVCLLNMADENMVHKQHISIRMLIEFADQGLAYRIGQVFTHIMRKLWFYVRGFDLCRRPSIKTFDVGGL